MGGIFGVEDDNNGDVLIEAKELLDELINSNYEQLIDAAHSHWSEYKKILEKLERHYKDTLFNDAPDFLIELIDDSNPRGTIIYDKPNKIKKAERGLKKILRMYDVEIPRKNQSLQGNQPVVPIQVYNQQLMSNEINISNEIKVEVDNALAEFEREISKSNPSRSKLKVLWDIIKKGAGYGALKLAEILVKKYI